MAKADKLETNPSVNKKKRWEEICKQTKICPFCSPHRSENAERHPRTDKYKNKKRNTIRKGNT